MRLLVFWLALATWLGHALAQDDSFGNDTVTMVGSQSSAALEQLVPDCTWNCVVKEQAIAQLQASCGYDELGVIFFDCIAIVCTPREQQLISSVIYDVCLGRGSVSLDRVPLVVNTILLVITLVALSLRCWAKLKLRGRLFADDWTALGAGATVIGYYGMVTSKDAKGLARHLWDVSPDGALEIEKVFYVTLIIFQVTLVLAKISLILFYLSVFPVRSLRLGAWWTLGFIVLSSLIIFICTVFRCSPLNAAWNQLLPGKCLNIFTLGYALSGLSIVHDIMILVLPIPELLKLQLSKARRAKVIGMFAVGSLSFIATIVRLKETITYEPKFYRDPTEAANVISLWSAAEAVAMLVCACLPSIAGFGAVYLPPMFGRMRSAMRKHMPYKTEQSSFQERSYGNGSDTNRELDNIGTTVNITGGLSKRDEVGRYTAHEIINRTSDDEEAGILGKA